MRLQRWFGLAFAAAAAAAGAVTVEVPVDGLTVNLSALMKAGHAYDFMDFEDYHVGVSTFTAFTYRLGVNGDVGEKFFYRAEFSDYYGRTFVGFRMADGFAVEAGRELTAFGVENQTLLEDLTTNSTTRTTAAIAPDALGLRFDYVSPETVIPFGLAAGYYPPINYSYHYAYRFDAAAARAYADVWPGEPELVVGGSYWATEEYRVTKEGSYPDYDYGHRYVFAPRVGGDVGFKSGRFAFQAEYMQYFIDSSLLDDYGPQFTPIYKSTYERGYYGLASYNHSLPWKYLQSFQPYARYERFEPAVLDRGDIADRRFTGGFALHFLANNLMFRSDYTRILEDEYPTKNDQIQSYFQVFF